MKVWGGGVTFYVSVESLSRRVLCKGVHLRVLSVRLKQIINVTADQSASLLNE